MAFQFYRCFPRGFYWFIDCVSPSAYANADRRFARHPMPGKLTDCCCHDLGDQPFYLCTHQLLYYLCWQKNIRQPCHSSARHNNTTPRKVFPVLERDYHPVTAYWESLFHWFTHRCPQRSNPGLFRHPYHLVLECDARPTSTPYQMEMNTLRRVTFRYASDLNAYLWSKTPFMPVTSFNISCNSNMHAR